MPLFPILCWANSVLFFEHPAKVKLVIVPHDLSDLTDTVICIFQQTLCVDHPQREKVLCRTYLHVLLEIADEPVRADVQRLCILLHTDFGIVVLVEVGCGRFDFFRDVGRCILTLLLLAADKKQDVVEQGCDVVLIPVLALLQLLNDLSERHLVFRQGSTVKDVLIQRDAMVLQNVLNVITSKVNPEHLRVVLNIVNILLNLFGLVKHHVPGVNDFLDSIKPEMCLVPHTRSDSLCGPSSSMSAAWDAFSGGRCRSFLPPMVLCNP